MKFYVATLANYVIVEAADADAARQIARVQLWHLTGRDPVIRTVRPATADEIEFQAWHDAKVAEENRRHQP